MDNQQGKIYWLGGFFDGECHIGITVKENPSGSTYLIPMIEVSNTHVPSIDRIIKIASELELPYYVMDRSNGSNPKWREQRRFSVQGMKRCEKWLDFLIPVLFTKLDQALLLKEIITLHKTRATGVQITPLVLEKIAELKRLNKRGN